jgi:outer membrane protein assembly factor BamB
MRLLLGLSLLWLGCNRALEVGAPDDLSSPFPRDLAVATDLGGAGPPLESTHTRELVACAGAGWTAYRGCAARAGRSSALGPAQMPAILWQRGGFVDGGGGFEAIEPAVSLDGKVLAPILSALTAFDVAGRQLWQLGPYDGGYWFSQRATPAIAADGTIYVTGSEPATDRLYALTPDGTRLWTLTTDPPGPGPTNFEGAPALAPDGNLILSEVSHLDSISPPGTHKWERLQGPEEYGNAVGPDGTIYVASQQLYALAGDGSVLHQMSGACKKLDGFRMPVVGESAVYAVDACGKLNAFGLDGTPRWTASVAQQKMPAIGADGTVYTDGSTLTALTPAGAVKWQVPSGGAPFQPVTIDGAGRIFAANGSVVRALDAGGTELWRIDLGVAVSSPALRGDGTIYLSAVDGSLFALR